MEIYTPNSLWERYDRKALPLMTTVLREEISPACTARHVYFNGEAAIDGCTRIYAVLFTPLEPNGAGIVYLGGVADPISEGALSGLLAKGYTVLCPDYAGRRAQCAFTIYPASLNAANYYESPDYASRLPNDPRLSCWYLWTTVALRAFTFLEQTEGVESGKICYFGVHTGGIQAVKAAALTPEAACTVTLYNAGDIGMDLDADEAPSYNASLDNTVYAKLIKRPYLMVSSSNPADDSLPYMTNLYAAADQDYVRMMLVPFSMDSLDAAAENSVQRFMQLCLANEPLPAAPDVSAKNSEGMLYFSVKTPGAPVALYYTAGGRGVYRNWRALPLTSVGEDETFARVNAAGTGDTVQAFASVTYADGLILTGEMLTVSLQALGIGQKPVAASRLLYEAEQGVQDWLILSGNGSERTIVLKAGAHGIEGVTSPSGEMSTLKVGDAAFRGKRDSTLQMTLFMPAGGTLELAAVAAAESGYGTFTAIKTLAPDPEWQKVSIVETDLHGISGGARISFESMVCLTLRFEGELLLNSLLWI